MLSSIIKYNLYFYLQKMLCVLSMNKVLKMTNAKPFLDSFDLHLTEYVTQCLLRLQVFPAPQPFLILEQLESVN